MILNRDHIDIKTLIVIISASFIFSPVGKKRTEDRQWK